MISFNRAAIIACALLPATAAAIPSALGKALEAAECNTIDAEMKAMEATGLKADLEKLQSDAEVILVEGRDHGSVFAPHELWPDGLMAKVHAEMWKRGARRARI